MLLSSWFSNLGREPNSSSPSRSSPYWNSTLNDISPIPIFSKFFFFGLIQILNSFHYEKDGTIHLEEVFRFVQENAKSDQLL